MTTSARCSFTIGIAILGLHALLSGAESNDSRQISKNPQGSEVTMLRWENREGRVIEASFQGLDGSDHVLLRLATGIVHRYPIKKLSTWSQEVAKAGGKPQIRHWTNKAGKSIDAAFEGMYGPDQVLLRPTSGELCRYPIENLTLESALQAKNDGRPPVEKLALESGLQAKNDIKPPVEKLALESGLQAKNDIKPPVEKLALDSGLQANSNGNSQRVTVLIIGDSLSLCGFGKRLDQKLRASTWVGTVATFMACGTNPLSWLKAKPYSTVKTYCGFWSIESVEGKQKPREVVDTYGMTEGHRPEAHEVPKLETLLSTVKPEILIIQSGNNLFSAFEDKKTIRESSHKAMIRAYVTPLIEFLAKQASPLRKVYWITPPQSGNVSEEIQTFVFEQIRTNAEPLATVIDSRKLTHYPYTRMGPDKEHFWGKESDEWADSIYNIVADDVLTRPIFTIPRLQERSDLLAQRKSHENLETPPNPRLRLRAKLLFKTPCPEPSKFAPYKEFMVGYKYLVQEVIEGKYSDKEILVMHPAYIQLKKQSVDDRKIGKTYDLHLRKLDSSSLWHAIRRDDASDTLNLEPYMLMGDEQKYPGSKQEASALIPCPCQGSS